MTGLRMDGTPRPKRDKVTPASIAKKWFDSHPESVVSYHWRWNELPVSSRDMLALPRLAMVQGNRIVFGPHRSELSLVGLTEATITDTGRLQIRFGTGGTVEYAALNQS
jgi:hypothetical protein